MCLFVYAWREGRLGRNVENAWYNGNKIKGGTERDRNLRRLDREVLERNGNFLSAWCDVFRDLRNNTVIGSMNLSEYWKREASTGAIRVVAEAFNQGTKDGTGSTRKEMGLEGTEPINRRIALGQKNLVVAWRKITIIQFNSITTSTTILKGHSKHHQPIYQSTNQSTYRELVGPGLHNTKKNIVVQRTWACGSRVRGR